MDNVVNGGTRGFMSNNSREAGRIKVRIIKSHEQSQEVVARGGVQVTHGREEFSEYRGVREEVLVPKKLNYILNSN